MGGNIMKNQNLNKLIKISLLSVMALVLMFIEVPIPIFPDFLKLDISDLPALFGGFALGPLAGIIILFMKNLLHAVLMTKTLFIGEVANFLIGAGLVGVSTCIYNVKKSKMNALVGLVLGTVVMALIGAVFNYYILIPAYSKAFGAPIQVFVDIANKVNSKVVDLKTLIIWSIIPFNLIKGAIVSAATMVVYKSVSPILHKERLANERREIQSKKSTM